MASSGEASGPDGGGEVKPSPAKPGKVSYKTGPFEGGQAGLVIERLAPLHWGSKFSSVSKVTCTSLFAYVLYSQQQLGCLHYQFPPVHLLKLDSVQFLHGCIIDKTSIEISFFIQKDFFGISLSFSPNLNINPLIPRCISLHKKKFIILSV